MRYFILLLMLLLPATALAQGSVVYNFGNSLTRNVSAGNVTKLTEHVARINVKRAAEDPPKAAITIEQYLDFVLTSAVTDYIKAENQEQAAEGCAYYKGQA